jgi:hypothetical protein
MQSYCVGKREHYYGEGGNYDTKGNLWHSGDQLVTQL